MPKKAKEKAKQAKAIVPRKPAEVVPPGRSFPSLWGPEPWLAETLVPGGMPSTDVYEDADAVVVKAEMPGMAREQIEVALAGATLTVKGEKRREEDVREQDYRRQERSYGAFVRSVRLPCEVNGDRATARFKDGVLEVRLPKTAEARRRSISVKLA
jgi:HSP20 family protein